MKSGIIPSAFVIFSAVALFATIYVPDNNASIQEAIDTSSNGDVVIARPGTCVENVFILVIDGIRFSESFGDPSQQFTPRLWELRSFGTLFTSCYCMGLTQTTSGHASINSGATQMIHSIWLAIYGNVKGLQEQPSIFQYLRHQKGVPEDKTWIFNGKGVMTSLAGVSWNPFYKEAYQPRMAFVEPRPDAVVWGELQNVIDTHHPKLTMVNFGEVDFWGHTGDWFRYVAAIANVDDIIYQAYQKIRNDPHYQDNTAIIITADHGRHLDGVNEEFMQHDCTCRGCRKIPLLIIGPGIKENAEVSRRVCQRDVAPTVASMLGIEADFATGRVLREAFESPPPSEQPARMFPSIAYGGDRLHLTYCVRSDSATKVHYTYSDDHGQTWDSPVILSSSYDNRWPTVATSDNRVAVAWSSAEVVNQHWLPYCVSIRESNDHGDSWSNAIRTTPTFTWTRGHFYPDLCYDGPLLNLVFSAPRYLESELVLGQLQDLSVVDVEVVTGDAQEISKPRCAVSPQGVHVVYQVASYIEKKDGVVYRLVNQGNWGSPVVLSEASEHSLRPDIAIDETGIHAVWAQNNDNTFKIVSRSSTDGINWIAPSEVGVNYLGAWRPRIETYSKGLIVVWEGYDTGKEPSIFGSVSSDGGITWSTPVQITTPGIIASSPAVAVDANDNSHVIWLKGGAPAELDSKHIKL